MCCIHSVFWSSFVRIVTADLSSIEASRHEFVCKLILRVSKIMHYKQAFQVYKTLRRSTVCQYTCFNVMTTALVGISVSWVPMWSHVMMYPCLMLQDWYCDEISQVNGIWHIMLLTCHVSWLVFRCKSQRHTMHKCTLASHSVWAKFCTSPRQAKGSLWFTTVRSCTHICNRHYNS